MLTIYMIMEISKEKMTQIYIVRNRNGQIFYDKEFFKLIKKCKNINKHNMNNITLLNIKNLPHNQRMIKC